MKNFSSDNSKPTGLTASFRPPATKICTGCKKEKSLKDFHLNSEGKEGRQSKCKDCIKEVEDKKKANQAEYAKKYFTF